MTVSSFTGVSLIPPSVLICLRRESHTARQIVAAEVFCVNVLSAEQRHLAEQFARGPMPERFVGISWTSGPSGVPVLDGTSAHLICTPRGAVIEGDHIVLFGQVLDGACDDKSPLVHWASGYRTLATVTAQQPS
jgi:flavin reductase (DIM6/NTAB) family NADH-FMN oxidoreductase RutF